MACEIACLAQDRLVVQQWNSHNIICVPFQLLVEKVDS